MSSKLRDSVKTGAFVFGVLKKAAPAFSLLYPIVRIVLSLLPSAEAFLSGVVIDRFQDAIVEESGVEEILLPVVLLLIITAVQSLMSQAAMLLQSFIRLRSDKYLVGGILKKLSQLKFRYFEDNARQDAVNNALRSDFSVTRCYLVTVDFLSGMIQFLSLTAVLMAYYPLIALAYLILTLPDIFVTAAKHKKMDQFSIDSMPKTRRKDYYYSLLTEKKYAKDIRIWNLFDVFRERFRSVWKEILKERETLFLKNLRQQTYTTLIAIVGYAGMFAFLVWKTMEGEMTLGGLAACTAAISSVASCFREMAYNIFAYVTLFLPRAKMLADFYAWEEEPEGEVEAVGPGILEFRNVTFRYPGTKEFVLQGLSFRVEAGEKIALVGVNGAGKTTIVKLLLRLYEPDEGEILFCGHPIQEYDLVSWRRLFGVCFQEISDYALTYGENIAMGEVSQENEASVRSAAIAAGLGTLEELPDLQTQMLRTFSSDGMELSGGQWQKMAVARAYYRDAAFLVLDEPSSKLDAKAEDHIFASFSELSEGRSGILISHRLSNLMTVDRILVLEQGRISQTGTHSELMSQDGSYAKLYRLQADSYRT